MLALAAAMLPIAEFRPATDGWSLMVDGSPAYLRGAGAPVERLVEIHRAGGNATRTWGLAEDTRPLLDEAARLGMKVIAGVWMQKEGDGGFSYADPAKVQAQEEAHLAEIARWLDHPAIIMWAVGNEMELGADFDLVFPAVNRLARRVKELDPRRPAITVVADMWPEKMDALLRHCPDIDGLGVNSYGGLPTLHQRMARWKKPLIITEFQFSPSDSPTGEVVELNSTEKARQAAENYRTAILGQPAVVGSFLFYWNASSTQTSSMHSTHLKTGEKLGIVDEMTRLWSGREPRNRAPVILGASRQRGGWDVRAADPDGDPLRWAWEAYRESKEERFVGDFEQQLPIAASGSGSPPFAEPMAGLAPGTYRLVAIARDARGAAAVWNTSYRIEARP